MLLPIADITHSEAGILVSLALVVGGGIQWVLNFLTARAQGRRDEAKAGRKDTIGEWQAYADRIQKDVDRLQRQVDLNEAEIKDLQRALTDARIAEAVERSKRIELEGDIKVLSSNIRRLQERANDLPPGVTRPMVVIADGKGTVVSVSPEVGSMFHWIPKDLLGQSIEVLMPREIRHIHRRAMERLFKDGQPPDPDKPILSYGMTKDGGKFPVAINLSGWIGVDGTRYVNAEIRRRGDSDSGVIYLPTKDDKPPDETPAITN